MVLGGKKIYPAAMAQVRAGCTERDQHKKFADMFYNVVGVSKSFDPMLPTSNKSKRGETRIDAELLKLKYGQRTPVFLKENSKHRKFGCWYLRIRTKNKVYGPLEGIIKIEKMMLL